MIGDETAYYIILAIDKERFICDCLRYFNIDILKKDRWLKGI